MRKLMLMSLSILLLSCDNASKGDPNAEQSGYSTEVVYPNEDKKKTLSEIIEVVSVETGWYNEQCPQIKIKFRNKSGKSLNDYIKVKYQFVEGDEVFDEGSKFLHSGSDVDWDNGLCKSCTFRSSYGYSFGGQKHKVRVKVCFDDNSLVWGGNIQQKMVL